MIRATAREPASQPANTRELNKTHTHTPGSRKRTARVPTRLPSRTDEPRLHNLRQARAETTPPSPHTHHVELSAERRNGGRKSRSTHRLTFISKQPSAERHNGNGVHVRARVCLCVPVFSEKRHADAGECVSIVCVCVCVCESGRVRALAYACNARTHVMRVDYALNGAAEPMLMLM